MKINSKKRGKELLRATLNINIKAGRNFMKNKLFQSFLFLALIGLLIITQLGKVSAQTSGSILVSNLSNNAVIYSNNQLFAMPQTTVFASEYCYGSLVTYGNWSGVSLAYLLQQSGLDPTVASIYIVAQDGYEVSLPIQDALQPDVIIAYQLNGVLLAENLRLVIPEENGNMWIAMISSISMSTGIVAPGASGGLDVTLPTNTIPPLNSTTPTPIPTKTPTPTLFSSSSPTASPSTISSKAQLWNFSTGNSVESSPTVFDGVVYVGSEDGKVYALNAVDGAQIWNYSTGGAVVSSPHVVDDIVYIGSGDDKVYALNASNGSQIWNYTTGGYVGSSPDVVGSVMYVGSQDGKVYAISAGSTTNSKIPTTYIIVAAAVIITVITLTLALGRRKINRRNNYN